MTYLAQSRMTKDTDLVDRVVACAALEKITDPQGWVWEHVWEISAQPLWASAYASALENEVPDPGASSAVIPDLWILSAVQAIRAAEPDPAE